MTNTDVGELVRQMESDDVNGQTTISKYVTFSMRENLEKIDAYLNSKHISGDTDSQGREKPFFNIVTAAVNVWFRATDIDRKDIRVKATKASDFGLAFVAQILLQKFMRETSFGVFLNDWGRSLARYGSSVLKFVEKEGELHCEVIPWNRLIVDPIDFDANPKVEKLWLTPAQLKKRKGYNKEIVEQLMTAIQSRETTDGQKKDTKALYIPIYEIHGELPLSYLTGKDDDEFTYVQQMHVITFLEGRHRGEFDDYTLISGREAKDPYMITHLIKEDGRTLAIGAVEHLFETQWMQNHSIKVIKDQLDLASKLIFQTSDGRFVGQNVLSAIESGDILIHQDNRPLTLLNNKADIYALQSYQQQWKQVGNEIVGISESMLGAAPKSGTAWRQTEALLQESHNLFEMMTENKGLAIEQMMTKYIIPFLKKKMDTTEEISEILEEQQIKQIDSAYLPVAVSKAVQEKMLNTVLAGQNFYQEMEQDEIVNQTVNLQNALQAYGSQRFIKPSEVPTETWKDVLEDFEWDMEVNVTGESTDRQAVMTTLTTVLQTIAQNPGVLTDPRMKLIFNRIISEVGGISPIELSQAEFPSPVQPAAGGQVGSTGTQPGAQPGVQPIPAQ